MYKRQALSRGITDSGSSGNSKSDMWSVYVPLIIEALNNSPSTPDREAAKSILSAYKGDFIEPLNRDTILDSPTVSDGYMLLAAIQSQLIWVLFNQLNSLVIPFPPFEPLLQPPLTQPTVGDPIPTTNFEWNMLGNTLLAARGGGFNGNKNNFDWGANVTDLITDAVDTAIVNLGGIEARPWGLNKRGITEYDTSFLDEAGEPITYPGTFKLNRSAYYKIAELNKCKTTLKEVTFCGQSGDPLSPHYICLLYTSPSPRDRS